MSRTDQEWTKPTKLNEQPGNSQDSRVNPLVYDYEETKMGAPHMLQAVVEDSNILSSNDAESAQILPSRSQARNAMVSPPMGTEARHLLGPSPGPPEAMRDSPIAPSIDSVACVQDPGRVMDRDSPIGPSN